MAKLDDPNEVEAQYRDSTNLDARVEIYEPFRRNPVPWLSWVYDRLAVARAQNPVVSSIS